MSARNGVRLLGTGSRFYPARRLHIIQQVLRPYLSGITPETRHLYVFRHGAGRPLRDEKTGAIVAGFDYLASKFWLQEGGVCEPYPANWRKFKNGGGPVRNRAMIQTEPVPDECLGFPWFEGSAQSKGTLGCMNLAFSAGIPTWRVKVDGTKERYTGTPRDQVQVPGLRLVKTRPDDLQTD